MASGLLYASPTMALVALRPTLDPTQWNDRELLARVLRSEQRAWNELLRRYRPLIYRCITKVTSKYAPNLSIADVEEVYADVLLHLLRDDMHKLRLYDPARGTKLGSWIGMIAVNAAYDFLRGVARRPLLDQLDGAIDPHEPCDRTPLDELLDKERWQHFVGMLGEFSAKDRTFLDLYYARGLEAEEVAEEMQISLKTVYSKKHKIRAHLQRCLDRVGATSAIADLALVAA
jgi:RNA polymerase sigma-70 factor, ECF subfamily